MSKKEQKIITVLEGRRENYRAEYKRHPEGSEPYERNLRELMAVNDMIALLTDKEYLDDMYEIWDE